MHQVIEVAFDIRVCRKINSSRVMDTAALQCERLDISVRTVRLHLSWLVSRVASSRVSGISKQKLPNTFQFWAFFFEKISHILKSCSDMLLSRLSTCYGTISRDTVQLEDLLGHGCESMFARGGGRMVSIVTMCHVRRTQMLCCWQQHAPSGNCQHCQQNAKNAHLMSQDPVGWYVLICLWWQYGSSRYPKPTYIQSGNMHMYPVWVYFLCTTIVCAQYTSKGGGTCNYMVHRSKQTVIRKCMSKCMECSQ